MKSRYYDPVTCKFINADDPRIILTDIYNVKSIYIWDYCEFSPVIHIDPEGYKIRLVGTSANRTKILGELRKITNSALAMNKNGFVTIIQSANKNSKYKKGDKLIERVINSKYTCTIQIQTKKGNYITYDNQSAASISGSHSKIWFNPNSDPSIQTINPSDGIVAYYGSRPSYIGLAHELIHADRSMRGVRIPSNQRANYTYLGRYKKHIGGNKTVYSSMRIAANEKKEELATVGIKFNKSGDITENMIRKEHGLWLRGAY